MPLGLTPPPTAPSLSDPSTFAARADAFVAWFATFISEWAALSASQFFAVLGTVSQSAGVPTGAIIERGSNANGEYVRFADGTQICTHEVDYGSIVANGAGTLASPYHAAPSNWDFPAAFVSGSIPSVAATGGCELASASGPRRAVAASVRNADLNRAYQVQATRVSSDTTTDDVTVQLTATGRWF